MELEFNAVRGTAGGVTSGMRLTFGHLSEEEREAVRSLVRDPAFREQAWLIFNRVPFDLATSIDAETRRSMCIAFAEFVGVPVDPETGEMDFTARRLPRPYVSPVQAQ